MTNLIFVTIDDLFSLNAWPMYRDIVQTPNLDALQAGSADFSAAFSDVAVCNPSRAAILTGRGPWDTGVVNNKHALRDFVDLPTETLPGILTAAGVHTAIGGKVFHDFYGPNQASVATEILDSTGLRYTTHESASSVRAVKYGATDEVLADDTLAESAVDFLESYESDTPFAMFLGIFRPHIDWVIPQEYLDIYADIDIQIPDDIDNSERAPFTRNGRIEFHNAVLDADAWQDLVRHYLASVTYADAKLGEILDALAASPHAASTTLMVTADHGYHLGDAGLWHKHTLYDQSAQVPLVIAGPNIAAQTITAPVNLSQLAATALDVMGVDVPDAMNPSLLPLLSGDSPTGDEYAVTWVQASVSIRTADYRYSLYENGNEELFHIASDPMHQDNLIDELPEVADQLRAIAATEIEAGPFIRPSDTVEGSDGDDYYYLSRDPVEIIDSGGRDRVVVEVSYIMPDHIEDLETLGSLSGQIFHGNAGGNYMWGSLNDDELHGNGGDDVLSGFDGVDTVYGGFGDDEITGGTGADWLMGDDGADWIDGEVGDDRVEGGDGADLLFGAAGDDTVLGGAGDDVIDGGANNDRLEGGPGSDTLTGGHGWDQLVGGAGINWAIFSGRAAEYQLHSGTHTAFWIDGPDGRDLLNSMHRLQFDDLTMTVDELFWSRADQEIVGDTSANVLVTHSGQDIVIGGAGNDTLNSRSNDDWLHGGPGDDMLLGGFGQDMASYLNASGSVYVSLRLGISSGAYGADTLIDIENIVGGDHNDKLVGDRNSNLLRGAAGDDVIIAASGHDRVEGGEGNDMVDAGYGHDTVTGAAGEDDLLGGNGNDVIFGGPDADRLLGQRHDDLLFGGVGDDRLFGNLDNDALHGEDGADILRGGFGTDTLFGGAGDDRLFGEFGSDRLHGGAGDDVLFGGSGGGVNDGQTDTFVFLRPEHGESGRKVIVDFEDGIDQLDLSDFGFSDFAQDILPLVQTEANSAAIVLRFAPDYTVEVRGLQPDSFDASDIML